MNLRIKRTWRWVRAPGAELRIGGPAQLILEPTDVLEVCVDGSWVPVPIHEEPKPEHPADVARREALERLPRPTWPFAPESMKKAPD